MSNSKNIFEISLTSLSQNGLSCKNIKIDWEKPSCANIKCDFDGKKIKVTVPEGCEGECIYATVRCEDDNCSDCPDSERIKICPCTVNTDCDDCEQCIDNLCVSKCPDDKFCDNDRCVECNDEIPCPCNQVCVSGDCQCLPTKPFKNDKGCCVDCLTDGDCPPCTICTPDGCMPIDCPDGACDPETGDCVDCLNTGDCTGENECCVGKSCECCPGFVRDPFTGKCVAQPPCVLDSDCDECEICVDGFCEPIECPEGYVCVGGECKPICDCDEPTCSRTEACVNLNLNTCYCEECEGDCSKNEDCGPGCYCKDGKCTPKPCKGSCENGADCGDGCGCQDGECAPCDSLDCLTNECENVLGCNCTGVGCRDIGGCEGSCSSSNDCGEGCTCYKGECVPCADFSCETDDCSDRPGCACINDKCQGSGDDCKDEFTVTKLDETCDIEAKLKLEEPCSCSKLTAYTEITSVSPVALVDYVDPSDLSSSGYRFNLDVVLVKGEGVTLSQTRTLPKLADINRPEIAHNETPNTGTIKVLVQPFFDEVDIDGRRVAIDVPGPVTEKSASFSSSNFQDTVSLNNINIPSPGSKFGEFLTVRKVNVRVQQSTDLTFPNNCTYDSIVMIDSFTLTSRNVDVFDVISVKPTSGKERFEGYAVLESDDERYPLFSIYRSETSVYESSDIYRKVYIPENEVGDYVDTLYGPVDSTLGKYPLTPEEGGLRSGKYYSFKNDCSCDPEKDLGKLVFCNPSELFYEALECNTKIQLLEPFKPCSVNSDLTKYGINDPSSQVKYELFLNGIPKGVFVDSIYGMVFENTTDSMFTEFDLGGESITEIKLVINHDDKDECTLLYTLDDNSDKTIEFDKDCRVSGSQYFVYLPKTRADYTITNVVAIVGGGTVVEEPTRFKAFLTKGVESELLVTFDDNCERTLPFNDNCCEEFNKNGVTFTRTSDVRDNSLRLDLNITGGYGPFNIIYDTPFGEYSYSTDSSRNDINSGNGGLIELTGDDIQITGDEVLVDYFAYSDKGMTVRPYPAGKYSVRVTDSLNCTKTIDIIVDKIEKPILTIDGYKDICAGESTKIDITGDASAANGVVSYFDGGANKTIVLDQTSKATITGITTTRSFDFRELTVDSYSYLVDEQVDITLVSNPNASIATNNNSICQGDSTTLVVTGTVGATATISNYGTVEITDANGVSIDVSPSSTTTYAIESVTFSSCVTGSGNSLTVVVNPPVSLSLISEECNSDLTLRTLTFDNLTSATDQAGNSLTVTNNTVTVDPTVVSQVVATYNANTCTKVETFNVASCDCPQIGYTILEQGVICEGASSFTQPVVINLAQTGNDVEVTDVDGNVVHAQTNIGNQFTMPTMSMIAESGLQLFVKITNNAIPSCFVENITIVPLVDSVSQPVISVDTDLCVDEVVGLSIPALPGATYNWTISSVDTGNDFTPQIKNLNYVSFLALVPGDYQADVIITNANGCANAASQVVTLTDCCSEFNPTIQNTCSDKKLDVVFLVDNSSSVDASEEASAIQGINDLVTSISSDVPDSRFSLINYASAQELVTSYVDASSFSYTSGDWGNLGNSTNTPAAYSFLLNELTGTLSPRNDAELVVILVSDDSIELFLNLGQLASNIENLYGGRNVVIQFETDNTYFQNNVATTLSDYYYEELYSNFPDITSNVIDCQLVVDGACPNAVYQWNDGSTTPSISVDTPGTYSVQITCGSCVYNPSITI